MHKLLVAALTLGCCATAAQAAPPDLTGMKLIFADDFDGPALDTTKWHVGTNVAGQQWGSDSYFVPKLDGDRFSQVYREAGGVLSIRAVYDTQFIDPNKWNRHWFSGLIIPLGADGQAMSAAFRLGCYEIRQKFPAGKGVWPANWAVNLKAQTGTDPKGAVELDGLEAYGIDMTVFHTTVHDWGPSKTGSEVTVRNLPDLTADFHVYDYCVDETNLTAYLDGSLKATVPLPRAQTLDKFFWMTNLAMGGGWPISVPEMKHYDMLIDYVRVYSRDADAVAIGVSPQ